MPAKIADAGSCIGATCGDLVFCLIRKLASSVRQCALGGVREEAADVITEMRNIFAYAVEEPVCLTIVKYG